MLPEAAQYLPWHRNNIANQITEKLLSIRRYYTQLPHCALRVRRIDSVRHCIFYDMIYHGISYSIYISVCMYKANKGVVVVTRPLYFLLYTLTFRKRCVTSGTFFILAYCRIPRFSGMPWRTFYLRSCFLLFLNSAKSNQVCGFHGIFAGSLAGKEKQPAQN